MYEVLVYLSLAFSGGSELKTYWNTYGFLPVPPFFVTDLNLFTIGVMWLGMFFCASIFLLASTMASKITIEQVRGDVFYSVGDALTFLKGKWQTVLGSFFTLPFFILLLLMIPVSVALLGKIPSLGKLFLILASLFSPIAIFIGVIIAFIAAVFIACVFFMPSIVAVTGADAFETIYQLFAIVWHQPWRLVCYLGLLFLFKVFLVPIWAIFCFAGFLIVLTPTYTLHTTYIQETIGITNKWLGDSLQKIASFFYGDDAVIFGFDNTTQLPVATISTTLCAILLTLTLIGIFSGIVAYLFSLTSVGTTLIYTIIRKRVDGQNLIEITGAVGQAQASPEFMGDE